MTTLSPPAPPVMSERFNFAFSGSGRHGVCLRSHRETLTLEMWALDGEEPECRTVDGLSVDRETFPLVLDDGRVLLFHRGGNTTSGRHEFEVLQPGGSGSTRQRLGEVQALPGGYLLPSPAGAHLGFAVTLGETGHSTIWRLSATAPCIEPVMRMPGSLSGGVWLDSDVLAINHISGSEPCSGIAIDIRRGSWRRIWSVSGTSTDRIALYSPRTRLLVVSTNAYGDERLGWACLGEGNVHFPYDLHRPGYARRALALDDRGERVLLHEVDGAVSRILTYTPASDRLTPLAGPHGTVSAPASWTGGLIRLPASTPSQPPTLATVRTGAPSPQQSRWSLTPYPSGGSQTSWSRADLIELPGPAGPIETIVYGGSGWRRCPHLVLALHGGPLSSWRFEFEPLFQQLAMAGIAVAAPNYRGSTGYGDAHLRAVIGDWAGPDLDDVLHIARCLAEERERLRLPRPVVLGSSYGAFLALLAACDEPQLWSACVALAPFLSARDLHATGAAAVRKRTEKLGGLKPADDATRPRDVLDACSSLTAPLLVMHGARDATISVEQSRRLRRRLLELGRGENTDFEYLESGGGHMDVARAETGELRQKITRFCLGPPGLKSPRPGSEILASAAGEGTSQPIPCGVTHGGRR